MRLARPRWNDRPRSLLLIAWQSMNDPAAALAAMQSKSVQRTIFLDSALK
jgi:hypothetical protein